MGSEERRTDLNDEVDATDEADQDVFSMLQNLEKQYGRYLLYAGLFLVIVVQIVLLFSGSDVVRATKFVLVDQEGNRRAVLGRGGNDGDMGLFLMDRQGTERIQLRQRGKTSGMYLFNRDGTDRLQLFQNGNKELSGLALFDQEQTNRLQISQDGKNSISALRFFDGDGTMRVWLGLMENRSYLDLYDQEGTRFWYVQ